MEVDFILVDGTATEILSLSLNSILSESFGDLPFLISMSGVLMFVETPNSEPSGVVISVVGTSTLEGISTEMLSSNLISNSEVGLDFLSFLPLNPGILMSDKSNLVDLVSTFGTLMSTFVAFTSGTSTGALIPAFGISGFLISTVGISTSTDGNPTSTVLICSSIVCFDGVLISTLGTVTDGMSTVTFSLMSILISVVPFEGISTEMLSSNLISNSEVGLDFLSFLPLNPGILMSDKSILVVLVSTLGILMSCLVAFTPGISSLLGSSIVSSTTDSFPSTITFRLTILRIFVVVTLSLVFFTLSLSTERRKIFSISSGSIIFSTISSPFLMVFLVILLTGAPASGSSIISSTSHSIPSMVMMRLITFLDFHVVAVPV
ncbi:hypothetical protein AGLY_000424 [Aphis glycines]|uniref:Uncharacterized protein n=1 Tax=Aphis glycines TaxID=307491 RepID=A0A6G0U6Y5_APHGL|nr:hypothetical protein AGLY_000424 [Aphis glycines]